MLKKYLKPYFKKNNAINFFICKLLSFYLKFVYFTSKWQVISENESEQSCKNTPNSFCHKAYSKVVFNEVNSRTIYALWHNRLILALGKFKNHQNITTLISPHSDGKIISKIVQEVNPHLVGKIIEGSSNKNSFRAVRQIIKYLRNNSNIIITPDGPRGPVFKINSNVTEIASKYANNLVPLSFSCKRKLRLKSWDQLIIPLPFNKILVIIGKSLPLSGDKQSNDIMLELILNQLTEKADIFIQNDKFI